MAYVTINPTQTDSGKPLDKLLMDTVRENLDDLDARASLIPVNVQDGEVATGTTAMVWDDTKPQNTEGDEYMTLAYTPTDAANKLKIEVVVFCSTNATNRELIAALFQDSTVDALATGAENGLVGDGLTCIKFTHTMVAGTTSATTFKIRGGQTAAQTFTFNGESSARLFGGTLPSSITITEVQP